MGGSVVGLHEQMALVRGNTRIIGTALGDYLPGRGHLPSVYYEIVRRFGSGVVHGAAPISHQSIASFCVDACLWSIVQGTGTGLRTPDQVWLAKG